MWFPLFAAGESLLSFVLNQNQIHKFGHVIMAALVTLLIILLARAVARSYQKAKDPLIPEARFSLRNMVELVLEQLYGLFQSLLGEKAARHFPFLSSVFIFIFLSNSLGLIPGFLSPTENFNTNLGVAIVVFVYYNWQGIREQGWKEYFKHFMGPVWWLAFLMIPIEIVSHIVRPLSLSLRLFGNINGDHLVLAKFMEMTPVLIPIFFIGFGLFVCFMQAFVFTFLSAIYINLASSDH
jgi:F-type H+-transporting ATPase subunit a